MPIRTLCNNNIKKADPLYQVGNTIISNNFELMNQNSTISNYNEKSIKISEIAKEYIRFRLCTIPTVPGEKRPIGHWKEYPKRLPAESEWNQWQEEYPTSLGIVMTNTLRIPLNRSYIRKFAYLGAGESIIVESTSSENSPKPIPPKNCPFNL